MNDALPPVSRLLLGLSAASAVVFCVTWVTGKTLWMGPAVTASLLCLSLAASLGRGQLHQLAFTIWIVAAVAIGMSFPGWFIGIGRELKPEAHGSDPQTESILDRITAGVDENRDGLISLEEFKRIDFQQIEFGDDNFAAGDVNHDGLLDRIELLSALDRLQKCFRFTRLFIPLLQIIMFAMGTTLSVGDFTRVFKMPTGVLIGLVCQFTIMPFIGFGLAYSFGLPPEIAAGLVLVGCSPSGLASNVMAFIARANVALSVTMTAFSTLLAPLLTPLLMNWLGGELVAIDVPKMMWSMTKIVLLPVLAGLVFHHLIYHRLKWLERGMPTVSMVGILIMTVLTVAVGRDKLLQVGPLLIVACVIHSTAGFGLGYSVCRLLGRDRLTCRTIALEVGLQNSGMAAGLAKDLGKVATLGLVPIVFGPVMNVIASTLANCWRARPAETKSDNTVAQASRLQSNTV
ncbi:MAG: bile acid:sodium symporter [Planctomycetota bacterium]|jgi:BASS family bile acid:Na+ symporter